MEIGQHKDIEIPTRGDRLKNLAFKKQNPKPVAPCTRDLSYALSKLQVIARDPFCSVELLAPVVIV